MTQQSPKKGIKDYLDSLVDEDGLRTEVTVTLTNRTLLKVTLYLVGTSVISTIAIYMVKKAITGD